MGLDRGIARSREAEKHILEETLRGEEPRLSVMGLPQLEDFVTLAVLAHEDEVDEARSRIDSLGKKGYVVNQSDEPLYWPFPSSDPPEQLSALEDTYKIHGSQLSFIVGILHVTDWDEFMEETGYN